MYGQSKRDAQNNSKALTFRCVVVSLDLRERAREEADWFIRSVYLCLKQNRTRLVVARV